ARTTFSPRRGEYRRSRGGGKAPGVEARHSQQQPRRDDHSPRRGGGKAPALQARHHLRRRRREPLSPPAGGSTGAAGEGGSSLGLRSPLPAAALARTRWGGEEAPTFLPRRGEYRRS